MAHGILTGKTGIITGALDEHSIAWKTALLAKEEGAQFILTNAPVALRMGPAKELAEQTGAQLLPADLTSLEDINKLYDAAAEQFGQIDFVLHSIGMSPNVRKDRAYTELNYDWYHKTLDVSAVSLHKMLQTAMDRDLIREWGSVVGLTYIAAQQVFPRYSDMTDAKSLLESIARTYGYFYGVKKKVRVNTISQSPTPTTAGQGVGGFDRMITFAERMSPLGNASAQECAEYIISLFSDYTRKVTMQNLYHDGGFSKMGVTDPLLDVMSREWAPGEEFFPQGWDPITGAPDKK